MHTVPKESIPAGENPFWHDSISMGVRLHDAIPIQHVNGDTPLAGVYIMASGMNAAHDFYIVDTVTGERLGIKLDRD